MAAMVIIYTRLPEAGTTKTRMIPALGAAGAAQLQREMTEHCLRRLRGSAKLRVDFTGDEAAVRAWLGSQCDYRAQATGDLGERLAASFSSAFSDGHRPVLAVGCDVPDLSADHITRTIELLATHDVVMGPAEDGGYYLIGMNHSMPELWADMPWGGDQVAALTRGRCAAAEWRLAELDTLSDVDLPDDLPVWEVARDAAAHL